MQNLSLYIHIPFCESKCYYCNFVSVKAKSEEKEKYINYLLKEIELNKSSEFIVRTIFIGGGTPSCLSNGEIKKILDKIYNNFCVDKNAEITIECNPNSFTKEKAMEYKKAGINRISFGLQTANDKLLKQINRIHTKNDFISAVKTAKEYGFNNINADVLIGIPNQKQRDVKKTLKLLLKLKIKHISCYSLILEENTKLFNLVNEKVLKLPSDETTVKFYDFVLKYLKKHNIYRYEVSNFAEKNRECKHNLVYWNLENYLGLGLNSHSKINDQRFENFDKFTDYYNSLDKNKKPIKNKYKLSKNDKIEEFIMLGLRKQEGINLINYKNSFDEDLLKTKKQEIDFLIKNNLICINNNFLFATNEGFKVLNQIILRLV